MSGPKSGNYHVVSAEELRRRRIAAAQDRYSRVLDAIQAFQGALSAAVASYGDIPVQVPRAMVAGPREAEDWDRASGALTAALVTAKSQLEDAVRTARLRTLAAEGSRLSGVLTEESGPRRTAGSAAAEPAAASDGNLAAVLARLPAGAPSDMAQRCQTLARAYLTASGQLEKAKVLDGIRFLVQAERDRQARIARNGAAIEKLYRDLDGLDGETVATLRGVLKGLDRAADLPEGLAERIAAAKAAAAAERDREFALAAAAKALGELGYAVGEDFRTAVPDQGGALLELPHSSRHGLQVRERNNRLMLNVVRFDHEGRRDPLDDRDAEESFCRDFARLRESMRAEGVKLTMLRADHPGQTPVQVLKDRSRIHCAARSASAPIERERSS